MATVAAPQPELFGALENNPHTFLQPPTQLHTSSLAFLKQTLDPIAASIAETQQKRLQESRKKRKRGEDHDEEDVLRLKKVHVDGFAIQQIWEQAKRVIDAARQEAERGLEGYAQELESGSEEDDSEDGEDASSEIGEEGVDWEYDGEDVDGEEDEEDDSEADLDGAIEQGDMHDDYEDDDEDVEMGSGDDYEEEDDEEKEPEPTEEYVPDPHGLNDGFFSIDDFNRQSEFLEQADARGDNNDATSDDEDIDWGNDPLGAGAAGIDAAAGPKDDDEDENEEDGPTFGNVDLNAPEGASDDEDDDDAELEEGDMDGLEGMGISNTNNVMYGDFFAPPAKKATRKNKKGRPNPHNFPAAQNPPAAAKNGEEEEEDMQRTMEAVHRDLFDESDEEEEEEAEELDPGDPRSRRSTHERRRAAIAEEIRKLEAANVAKREWTLSGEARAMDRPVNSLLEEDLEFERAGKPVPVITAEVSESIEELIKRRILALDFNDIPRRRPDDLATGRRGRVNFELEDTKNAKSLADMYEEEHLRRTDPNFVEAKDEKTQKEHKELEAAWRDIVTRLDSLSNYHYKPAAPAAQLDIRVDAPVVRLEDARPSAGADAATASQLAPQEVYKAGDSTEKRGEEIATRGGMPVAREELSREEKVRRRRREKERERKANANAGADGKGNGKKMPENKKSKERREIVSDLKKGNVKVIGRKGEITNVEGDKVKGSGRAQTGGSFKL